MSFSLPSHHVNLSIIHFSGTGTFTVFHATIHGAVSCQRLLTSFCSGVGKNDFTLFTVFHGSSVAHTTTFFATFAGAFITCCPVFVNGAAVVPIFTSHSMESASSGLVFLKSSHHFASSPIFSCCPVTSTIFLMTGETMGSTTAQIGSHVRPTAVSQI